MKKTASSGFLLVLVLLVSLVATPVFGAGSGGGASERVPVFVNFNNQPGPAEEALLSVRPLPGLHRAHAEVVLPRVSKRRGPALSAAASHDILKRSRAQPCEADRGTCFSCDEARDHIRTGDPHVGKEMLALISLGNFARTDHIGSFRSIAGEGSGGGCVGRDLRVS